MKNLWVRALLPLMVTSLLVACGSSSDDSGAPETRVTTPEQTPPPVVKEDPNGKKDLELPKEGQTDSTKPNIDGEEDGEGLLDEEGGEGSVESSGVVGAFTGAGSDYLRTYFSEQLNLLTGSSKTRNQDLANSIETARARVDQETGEALVTIQFRGDTTETQFAGPMGRDGIATTSSSQRRNTQINMICLDANPLTCYTSLLRVQTTGKKRSVSFVLIRHTNANAVISNNINRNGTNAYLKLVDLFVQTKEGNNSKNTLKTILVETFEVIGGASGVKVAILSKEQQLITATGPLVEMDPRLDGGAITMDRQMNLDDLIDLEKGRAFKTEMQDSISDVEMVANKGNGDISLRFTVSGDSKKPTRRLTVGIERQEVRVMPMKDLNNLFE